MVAARTVLLIDDDNAILEIVALYLERAGCHVITARNGEEALRVLKGAEAPGLILLDLMMPIMDGWQLLDILKHDPLLRDIPVVILSAHDQAWAGIEKDAVKGFLKKPIDTTALLTYVKEICK